MGVWIAVGVLLLALLGVVSIAQKGANFRRLLVNAQRERALVTGELAGIGPEVQLFDALSSPQAVAMTTAARDAFADLSRRFAAADQQLSEFHGVSRWWPSLDHSVDLARVLEEYEAVRQQLPALREQVDNLQDLLLQAGHDVDPLRRDWQSLRAGWLQAGGDDRPARWQQSADAVDAALLRMTAETDRARRSQQVVSLRADLDGWRRRLSRLSVWREWQQEGSGRVQVLTSAAGRLQAAGAGETLIAQQLQAVGKDATVWMSAAMDDLFGDEYEPLAHRLGTSLTGLLAMASQLLGLLADPQSFANGMDALSAKLQRALDGAHLAETMQRRQTVKAADEAWFADWDAQWQAWQQEAQRLLAPPPGAEGNKPDLMRADRLLQAIAQGERLQQALAAHQAAWQQAVAAGSARIAGLRDKLADELRQLATAGLQGQEVWRTLSDWAEEVERLGAAQAQPDTSTLDAWEARVAAQAKVVAAAVAARQDIDASLQAHLDALTRQGDAAPPLAVHHQQGIGHLASGNLSGAAWTTLALADSLANTSVWTSGGLGPW